MSEDGPWQYDLWLRLLGPKGNHVFSLQMPNGFLQDLDSKSIFRILKVNDTESELGMNMNMCRPMSLYIHIYIYKYLVIYLFIYSIYIYIHTIYVLIHAHTGCSQDGPCRKKSGASFPNMTGTNFPCHSHLALTLQWSRSST